MFSKSLFKQSCKASGTMWSIITVAVCFMLACVMLITGDGDLSTAKNAIEDTIIQDELTSEIERRALHYYSVSNEAMEHFEQTFLAETAKASESPDVQKVFAETCQAAMMAGSSEMEAQLTAKAAAEQTASALAYANAVHELEQYAADRASAEGYAPGSAEADEIKGIIFAVLNPMQEDGSGMFDAFYEEQGEEVPRYDLESLLTASELERRIYRQEYASRNSAVFLAGNIIQPENVQKILDTLADFGVTLEKYQEFGFNQYQKVKDIAVSGVVDFRANYAYRMENLRDGETEASVAEELTQDVTRSLLASLPQEVSDALEEIGQADLYGTLVGSIFFKMAGLLLPIIYMIMTANSLIAGQVDSGSMAYILSSSVKRRTVTFTQATYLVGSLLAMFCCTTITSIVCLHIVDVDTKLTTGKLLLINLGAFLVLFAMSGICFLTSCWFNRSKRSMAIGGGLNMFFLVAAMLGLFGSPVLPSILRMEALNAFNYVSIISLFDVVGVLEGNLVCLWKYGILVGIGLVCYIAGSEKFARKDLPL